MKTNKILYLSVIIICIIGAMIVAWCLLNGNQKISLNPQIDHLGIAKKIHANSISDDELANIFDNQKEASSMDKNLTVFLAGYLNIRESGSNDNQFFSTIDEAKGLKSQEKTFLKNIIRDKYLPIIKMESKI